jgi:hypothetical protein
VSRLEKPSVDLELRRTYIQTLSAISRSGGYRLGRQVGRVRGKCEGVECGGKAVGQGMGSFWLVERRRRDAEAAMRAT